MSTTHSTTGLLVGLPRDPYETPVDIAPRLRRHMDLVAHTQLIATKYDSTKAIDVATSMTSPVEIVHGIPPTGLLTGTPIYKGRSADIVVHCCNCFRTWGAGFARVAKTECPDAFRADSNTPHGDIAKLGTWSSGINELHRYCLVNLYGQWTYGRTTRKLCYAALTIGLDRLFGAIRTAVPDVASRLLIGTYFLGCFNAGGDREIVQRIIHDAASRHDLHVVILDQA